jgi:hypothetical protein
LLGEGADDHDVGRMKEVGDGCKVRAREAWTRRGRI